MEGAGRTARNDNDVPAIGRARSLLAAAAIALAACSASSSPPASQGTSSPTVASLPTSTSAGTSTGHSGGSTTTTLPKASNATALVDEWATCMRSHGDPDQTDPMIDSHGGINITVPSGNASHAFGEALHNVTGTCSQYLAAAQRVLRAEIPYTPFDPDTALIVQYANCMRANGVPNYPYPVGDQTNFNGTGINLNSPGLPERQQRVRQTDRRASLVDQRLGSAGRHQFFERTDPAASRTAIRCRSRVDLRRTGS